MKERFSKAFWGGSILFSLAYSRNEWPFTSWGDLAYLVKGLGRVRLGTGAGQMGVQCWALVLEVKNRVGKSLSSSYHLSVAFLGVPYFTVEPEDVSVSPNAPFHMACAAVGPPEPVTIVWWMGDSRVGLPDISPSILNVSGKAAASAEGHWASKVWKGRGEESSLPYMPKWHWVTTQFGNVLWLHVSEG